MPMPTETDVAGIVWTECGGIRTSQRQHLSPITHKHRLAVACCVVNRGRQNMPWGPHTPPGSQERQTALPSFPTASELSNPMVGAAWAETQRAAHEAMHTVSLPIDDIMAFRGAQLYCHTWHHRWTGPRFGGVLLANYEAWDHRPSIVDEHRNTISGPRTVWLNVHILVQRRDSFIRRSSP